MSLEFDIDNIFDGKSKSLIKEKANKKIISDRKIYVKFMDKQYNRVSNIEDLLGKLPAKGQHIRIITQKSFNAFAILLYIVSKVEVEEVFLAIYRIDKNSVQGIKKMLEDRQIEKMTIVLSNFFRSSKKTETWHNNLVRLAKSKENMKLVYCWNHAKILAVKTKNNDHFVVEGSGNLSDNARIEQYLFENCKETYLFHKSWIDDIFSQGTEKEVSEIDDFDDEEKLMM